VKGDFMQLTIKEKLIIKNLATCYNDFAQLDHSHPSDNAEFAEHIHILQRQIMARLARRAHPDIFKRDGELE